MKNLVKHSLYATLLYFVGITGIVNGQDLNSISGSGFNIVVGPVGAEAALNIPEPNTVTLGFQSEFNSNYRWQMVNAYLTDNFYLRRTVYGWGPWFKVFHSGNLNMLDVDFVAKNITIAEMVKSTSSEIYYSGYDAGKIVGFSSPEQANLLGMNFLTAVGFSQSGQTYQQAMSLRRFWNGSGYSSRLSVDGEVIAKEIKVQVGIPADYVFDVDYELMPLKQVEDYVTANKHLPNIPSAQTLVEEGWNVGEMNNKLLEKVEELTLYLIQFNKDMAQLSEENRQLKERLAELEKLLLM